MSPVIGVTHTADSALSMISMLSDAMVSGQQAVLDPDAGADDETAANDYEHADWIDQCSSVRH